MTDKKKEDFTLHKIISSTCLLVAFSCICWEYKVLNLAYGVILLVIIFLLVKVIKLSRQLNQLKKEDEKKK